MEKRTHLKRQRRGFGSERFQDALRRATRWHATQPRKGTDIPYISHLLIVAGTALEHGGTEDEAIAALLHDAIEDQGGAAMREEIRRHFGDRVVAIVDGCTDSADTPKPPWRKRKKAYLAHMATAAPSVLLVSISDKLHNARAILADYRTLGEALWPRFNATKAEILWYYQGLVAAFRARADDVPRALLDELGRVVRAIGRHRPAAQG